MECRRAGRLRSSPFAFVVQTSPERRYFFQGKDFICLVWFYILTRICSLIQTNFSVIFLYVRIWSHIALSNTDNAAGASRSYVPHLLPRVHDGAWEQLRRLHEESFRQVHRPLKLIHMLSLPARRCVSTN